MLLQNGTLFFEKARYLAFQLIALNLQIKSVVLFKALWSTE